jgi:uncharacterized protein involved in outer membrane biogenesis
MKVWRNLVLSLAIAVGFYAIIAGLVAPHFAKQAIADKLGERLGRQVALDELSFNPFTLETTAKGFRILEADGKANFASFDTLDVNGSASSIYRLAPVADSLTLSGLKVNLVRDGETHYNLSDILERLAAEEIGHPPTRVRQGSRGQQFSVSNIRIVDSSIAFDDQPKGRKHAVTDIDIAVPFISNLPAHLKEFVQPRFSAKVNGAPVKLAGETLPFEDSLRTHISVDLEALEVPPYVAYSPTALPVKVEAAKLDARLSVRFTQRAKDPSIDVSGTLGLRDLKLSSPQLEDAASVGRIDIDIASLDPLAGLLKVGSVRLADAIANGGAWKISSTELRDIRVDVNKKDVRVASLSTSGGTLAIRRALDGAIEMPVRASQDAAPATGEATPSPWTVALDKLALDGYQLALSDAAVKPAVTHRMTIASLQANDLSTQKGSRSKVAAKVTTEKGGGLDVDATLVVDPLALEAQVDARRIDLVAFRPYVTYFQTIALKSGNASAKGKLNVTGAGDAMRIAYAGGAEIARFATYDTGNKEELLDWESVRVKGIGFDWSQKAPLNLKIADIAVDKAYARVVVSPDGKINLTQLKFATAEQPAAPTPASAPPPARNVRIERVTFTDSRLDFTDHFIKPNYSADVGGLGGTVTDLSSDPHSRAVVDLKGSYDKTSPVVIAGTVNPLSGDLFLDIAAKGKDIELPKLSAYSTRYAGYGITAGKLNLDVKYHVEDGKLQGRNKIHLDQLTFGDKVEGPEATKLPVIFAVNLLKDSKGQIELELPINGSLEDPQFDIGGLIAQVVGSLLKKAITSPFSLLAAAFGGSSGDGGKATAGGDDLAFVDFEPGAAEIDAADQKKLDAVAKALLDRPAIRIEMAPRLDPEKDLEALKRAGLTRKVESAGSLKTAFEREGFPKKELPASEMETLLLAKIEVGEEEMSGLAQRRAERVKSYLLEKGQLPAERVLVAAGEAPAAGGAQSSRVDFTLK